MPPKRKQPTPSDTAAPVVRRSARLSSAAVTPPAYPEPPKKKKIKAAAAAKQEAEAAASPKAESMKTIVIEHCKQCTQFKIRAMKVKEGLEKEVAGVNVVVNREKPRRGCFEIREEGGEVFVSLLDMKRPFPPLKALDIDNLISNIVAKIR
ncbi:uncharacterized protein LOC130985386 [Salvia miltiorrhiza]|uniref:uncharacterized protein LOC130985386 n=1 Tax=Salvia miltiorrhiza TaxID=226208 RepID=UPI0025AD50A0|nr:uncharacterized protein LOC130985386 [Salvia miltiorrhiza]